MTTIVAVAIGFCLAGICFGIGIAMTWADRTIGKGMCKRG